MVAPEGATRNGCERPAAHFLHTTAGVVMVRSWSMLAQVLEKAASSPERVARRQRVLMAGLRAMRRRDRRALLETAAVMRASVSDPSRCVP